MTTDEQQGNGREYHPTTREARLAQALNNIYTDFEGYDGIVIPIPLTQGAKQQIIALIDAEIAAAVAKALEAIRYCTEIPDSRWEETKQAFIKEANREEAEE